MTVSETGRTEWVESTGRTVAEAVANGLELLGVQTPEDAEVEVLSQPQRGIWGLGGRGARVRMRLRADRVSTILRLVREILRAVGLGTTAEATAVRSPDGYIRVEVSGPSLGGLIGHRGETLDALQYLLNLVASRLPGPPERVILDAGGYRERRRVTLERLAWRIAQTVRRTGREVALEPMTPQERKVVHLAIAGETGVRSESRGQEPFRYVVVCPDGERAGEA